MSHDYDPSWDYPVVELSDLEGFSDAEKKAIETVIERVRKDLVPALTFNEKHEIDVFFSEHMGLHGAAGSEVMAIYCNGTQSRPVVGFDLQLLRDLCHEEGLNFMHQFEISLAHELGHAYQESAGLDDDHEHGFDEDDAEEFARAWVDAGEINLWVLDPAIPNPQATHPKP